jgi:hypothetical protein
MDEYQAHLALSRPLVFGDEEQICAVHFLDAVAETVEALRENPKCEQCQGDGSVFEYCGQCDGAGCEECGEDGGDSVECLACGAFGIFVIDWPACSREVMEAAKSRILRELH